MERIQKTISATGAASRRGAEELVRLGKVFVNGKKVREVGMLVDPTRDIIKVDGKLLAKVVLVAYLVNKPKGVVCSKARQGKEQIITDLVPAHPPVYPVGRLDKDSEGLIIVTNNGDLAHALTHPSFDHSKTYEVTVTFEKEEHPTEWICQKLSKGVKLGDGKAVADKVVATVIREGSLHLSITVHEGRHHLIRRMCAAIGLNVKRLQRTKISGFTLNGVKPGSYRLIEAHEIIHLTTLRSLTPASV
jgi:23S rRNA pseudouridine2605 synthase